MNDNEKQFMDYFYTNYIVNKITNVKTINEAYRILYGETPKDNCSACIKSRLEQLKTKYVLYSKINKPELLNGIKKEKTINKNYEIKTITGIIKN